MGKEPDFVHPSGLDDVLPEDHIYNTFIKKVVRHRCRQSGYRRITPSIMVREETYSSIYKEKKNRWLKDMYKIESKEKSLYLRSELTTGILRSYIEHDYQKLPQPVELYAIESVYTKSPDKKGFQQYTRFDVEVIGEADIAIDAQVIYLAQKILKDLGIMHRVKLEINNLGDRKCQQDFEEELRNFYCGKEHVLGEEGQKLLETDPVALLTSEEEDLVILAQMAPKLESVLDKKSKEYSKTLTGFLDELGIEYENNSFLRSDFGYYTNTFFAFVDRETNDQILVGGRYNNIIEDMGGPKTSGVGFYANFEDITRVMRDENIYIKDKDSVDIFVAQLGVEAKKKCMSLMMQLREAGVHAIGALGKGSMKEQLALAEKFKSNWTIIMGHIEVIEGIAIIRNMVAGSQEIVRYDDLLEEVIERVGEENLDKYSVGVEETVYKGDEEIVGEEYEELVG